MSWLNGSQGRSHITYEPVKYDISRDHPIVCAAYAKKHDLLDAAGWKHLKQC